MQAKSKLIMTSENDISTIILITFSIIIGILMLYLTGSMIYMHFCKRRTIRSERVAHINMLRVLV